MGKWITTSDPAPPDVIAEQVVGPEIPLAARVATMVEVGGRHWGFDTAKQPLGELEPVVVEAVQEREARGGSPVAAKEPDRDYDETAEIAKYLAASRTVATYTAYTAADFSAGLTAALKKKTAEFQWLGDEEVAANPTSGEITIPLAIEQDDDE